MHIHKRITTESAKEVFSDYDAGKLDLACAVAKLGLRRRRFFDLLARYRKDPGEFALDYVRASSRRISLAAERRITAELLAEKKLIDDPKIPLRHYNYSAVRDALGDKDITVSVPTIIARAKALGCYKAKPARAVHDREVITNYAGELIQHDASIHRWSPYAEEDWYAITSIDDYSRMLLFADLFRRESSWAHISAAESLILGYGCPLKYYADQHAIFRFVERRDTIWRKSELLTDGRDTQWTRVLKECGIEPVYALSPQAKGKIERPYRWMQDRVVRRSAKGKESEFERVRGIFREEAGRYNTKQVHSTTGEIPLLRYERAVREGRSVFRPFVLPKPFLEPKDIFCLKTARVVDAYRRISLKKVVLQVSGVMPREHLDLRIVPDLVKGIAEVRMWHKEKLVGTPTVKLDELSSVHF